MNAVESIKMKHDLDVFLPLFQTEEIKRRRAERMRWDAMKVAYEQKRRETMTKEAWKKREREMERKHQMEVADTAASVAGGLTMAASILALAMLF